MIKTVVSLLKSTALIRKLKAFYPKVYTNNIYPIVPPDNSIPSNKAGFTVFGNEG